MLINKIKKLGLLHILFGVALFISLPTNAYSEPNWQTLIIAEIGVAKNKITIGQNAKATDGMDHYYDVSAMISGDVTAYLQSAKGALWQEIKGLGKDKTWTLKVDSNLAGKEMEISLNRAFVPQGYTIYLHDTNSGATTNMTQTGSYKYIHSGARTFIIKSVGLDVEADNIEDTEDTEDSDEETTADSSTVESNTTVSSGGFFRGSTKNQTNTSETKTNESSNKTTSSNVATEYESYYKPSTKKLKAQVAGLLKKPSNLRGWVKKKQGLYLEWDDKSGGEHGFIVEKKCSDKKEWSLIAALWGVSPTYNYKKTTLKVASNCQYRVIAFNHKTESDYSDIATFTTKGEILIVEEIVPTAPVTLEDKKTTEIKSKK